MGAFCCHGNQSSDPIWPKTLCSQSPTPVMLQIKFDCYQLIGLGDIHVWKCAHGRTHGRTPARPVYYKLTSELKIKFSNWISTRSDEHLFFAKFCTPLYQFVRLFRINTIVKRLNVVYRYCKKRYNLMKMVKAYYMACNFGKTFVRKTCP